MQADLGTLEGPKHLIGEAARWAAKIDILVNNAGLERVKGLGELSAEDYSAVFDVNVRGTILLTQAALPYLNPNARVVNISSVGARAGFKNLSLYCSSKAALGMIVKLSMILGILDLCDTILIVPSRPHRQVFSEEAEAGCSLVKLACAY